MGLSFLYLMNIHSMRMQLIFCFFNEKWNFIGIEVTNREGLECPFRKIATLAALANLGGEKGLGPNLFSMAF